jgi:hypothetical protein
MFDWRGVMVMTLFETLKTTAQPLFLDPLRFLLAKTVLVIDLLFPSCRNKEISLL